VIRPVPGPPVGDPMVRPPSPRPAAPVRAAGICASIGLERAAGAVRIDASRRRRLGRSRGEKTATPARGRPGSPDRSAAATPTAVARPPLPIRPAEISVLGLTTRLTAAENLNSRGPRCNGGPDCSDAPLSGRAESPGGTTIIAPESGWLTWTESDQAASSRADPVSTGDAGRAHRIREGGRPGDAGAATVRASPGVERLHRYCRAPDRAVSSGAHPNRRDEAGRHHGAGRSTVPARLLSPHLYT
jgi:hypothetical protein